MAVPAGAPLRQHQHVVHRLGGNQRRVQAHRPGRGGSALGGAQKQTQHELRQAEQGAALLLRQEHHDQSPRQALRLQVRFPRPGAGVPAVHHGAGHLQVSGELLTDSILRDFQTEPRGSRRWAVGFLLLARVPSGGPVPQPQPAASGAVWHRVSIPHQLCQQHQQSE